MKVDFTKLTYRQMADLIEAVGVEVKNRNSIGVNMYVGHIRQAWAAVNEIANGEAYNFTSESGPREPKPVKPRKNCRYCHGDGGYKVGSHYTKCSCVLPKDMRA